MGHHGHKTDLTRCRLLLAYKHVASQVEAFFFFGRGALSQIVPTQTKPASGAAHAATALSALGPGALIPQARGLRGWRRPHSLALLAGSSR